MVISSKYALFLIVIVLIGLDANSQDPSLGTWNIINFRYNYNTAVSAFAEGQVRSLQFYDEFHYYEFKGGVNYRLNKSVQFTLAAGTYQTYKEGGNFELPKNNDEFRLWPQLVLFQGIGRLNIEQRYRVEMRWTSNGYRNRYRYRFGVSYPFGNDEKGYRPFQVNFNNELFFTDKEPYFERNRAQLTFNYKVNSSSTFQLGYLHQFDYKINDETGTDFIVVGFYHELYRKAVYGKEMEHKGKQ